MRGASVWVIILLRFSFCLCSCCSGESIASVKQEHNWVHAEACHEELKHWPMPVASGVDVLRFMMQEHGLTQGDLPGVGPQSAVLEILSGKRQLNIRQIRWLAGRFGVSVETFI